MEAIPVIAIFDIGKTNKKLFLFDENYRIVLEKTAPFEETEDEDGFPCENLESLKTFISDSLNAAFAEDRFEIKAVNFSTYGASFVYIDSEGKDIAPLYNYLKPYPELLQKQFYDTYGGEDKFAFQTASPVLGSLNSGMQLYRIKYEKPELLSKISYALHLPQFMSFIIAGKAFSDITSIGCHTNLWDFQRNAYHEWVEKESLINKLAPIVTSDHALPTIFEGKELITGIGLHDSSAALIPYLVSFHEPFVLISTGTWCISINPFNHSALSLEELSSDCLCYMNYKGKPVKASRLFAGHEHELQVKKIAEFFHLEGQWFRHVRYNPETLSKLQSNHSQYMMDGQHKIGSLEKSLFENRDLFEFESAEEAYHQLILDIVSQQFVSTNLVLQNTPVKRIFVDGGFSKNAIYMNLMAIFFPDQEIYAASMAQATAVGTALAIHKSWNNKPLPSDIIKLKLYSRSSSEVM